MLPIVLAAGEALGDVGAAAGDEFGDDCGLVRFVGGEFESCPPGCSGHR